MDVAISSNKRLCNSNIVLNKNDCLPHISLLMGCLSFDKLERAQSMLKVIGSQHNAMKLYIPGIRTVNTPAGDVITLDIAPNEDLQQLHESVVNAFSPLISTDATDDDVLEAQRASGSTLDWINNFITQSSFKNFWPHITIGYLKESGISEQIEPLSFTTSRLAICHLGNYCTCKVILKETSLCA